MDKSAEGFTRGLALRILGRAGLVLAVLLFVGGMGGMGVMARGAGGAEGPGSEPASKAGAASPSRARAEKAPASGKTGEAAYTHKTDETARTSKPSKAARTEKATKTRRSIPIVITAKTMKADRTSKTVVFKGDVEAREDFLLCSEELRMEYGGANDVRKIDATGNVRIYRASGLARAARAVFDRRSQTLLLTGNAAIERCTDTVHGDRITLYLEDDSALVEGLRGGRVKARIIPESHCPEGRTGGKNAARDAATGVIDVKNTHCYGPR